MNGTGAAHNAAVSTTPSPGPRVAKAQAAAHDATARINPRTPKE